MNSNNFPTLKVQRYEMIIRLSGEERKPGSRLSVLELSIGNIRAENESQKIRNAETGKPRKIKIRSRQPFSVGSETHSDSDGVGQCREWRP